MLIGSLVSVGFILLVVHRPVRDLIAGTKRVAAGNLGHRLTVHSADELGELAASFNRMTADLARAHAEITAWTRTLEARVEKKTTELEQAYTGLVVNEKMASLGKLAATVAHEVNNPLFGILTYSRLVLKQLEKDELTPAGKADAIEQLRIIERESKRCGEIMRNLLDFARQAPPRKQPQALNVLVGRALTLVRHQAALQGTELVQELAPDLPQCLCDADQVQQVILVLLVNALEAMPHGGRVEVVTQLDASGAAAQIRRAGQRAGHRSGCASAHLRTLLHHQRGPAQDGAGAGGGLQHRRASRWYADRGIRAGEGRRIHFDAAAGRARGGRRAGERRECMTVPQTYTAGQKGRILIVDDELVVRDSLQKWFDSEGYDAGAVSSGREALFAVQQKQYDLALLDIKMPGMDGMELQKKLREVDSDLTVVIMTGYASVETAVEALKMGAYDYITKPIDPDELVHLVSNALGHKRYKRELERLRDNLQEIYPDTKLIGNSPAIRRVLELVEMVAATDTTVLIFGESGTGKELVARAIHAASPRRNMPMVVIHCGALTETLLESELFGHERGAFTGAQYRKKGKFEVADGGSVFLDEISDISLKTQTDLLRVLQEKEIQRVGGSQTVKVDFRCIAATNKNLEDLVKAGTFRPDLYYRLNVFAIDLPPLRERREDIPLLADHFLKKFATAMNKPLPTPGAAGGRSAAGPRLAGQRPRTRERRRTGHGDRPGTGDPTGRFPVPVAAHAAGGRAHARRDRARPHRAGLAGDGRQSLPRRQNPRYRPDHVVQQTAALRPQVNAASSSIGAIHLQPVGEGVALELLDDLAAALARTFRVSCHVRTSAARRSVRPGRHPRPVLLDGDPGGADVHRVGGECGNPPAGGHGPGSLRSDPHLRVRRGTTARSLRADLAVPPARGVLRAAAQPRTPDGACDQGGGPRTGPHPGLAALPRLALRDGLRPRRRAPGPEGAGVLRRLPAHRGTLESVALVQAHAQKATQWHERDARLHPNLWGLPGAPGHDPAGIDGRRHPVHRVPER